MLGDSIQADAIEIEVTPAMIAAGVEEMTEHNFGCDTAYVLGCVYRAMAYAALSAASPISRSK
jgi:hypothetical protein